MNLKLGNLKEVSDNAYIIPFLLALKTSKTEQEKIDILNKLYGDGFEDGYNHALKEDD